MSRSVKKFSYKTAPRRKITDEYSFNISHINSWDKYCKDVNIQARKIKFEDIIDYAEVEICRKKSVNNYLSTIINYVVSNNMMQPDPYFERRYGNLRKGVKRLLKDVDPAQAPVILPGQLLSRSKRERAAINIGILLGWRFAHYSKICTVDEVGDAIVVKGVAAGRKKTPSIVRICCNCDKFYINRFCLIHGPGWLIAPAVAKYAITELGCSLHSMRRTLCVSLRVQFELANIDIGPKLLKRINRRVGWSESSNSFWAYSKDWEDYTNQSIFPVCNLVDELTK